MTRQSVENYRIEITIGTIVLCALFLFGTAYKIGAGQTKTDADVQRHEEQIKECKQKAAEQDKINSSVSGVLIEMSKDIKHIREAVEDLKSEKRSRQESKP